MRLAERLDALADAYAAHGLDPRPNLLPGASATEIDDVESALGVRLPAAYRELYGWSAGTADELGAGPWLRFRDMHLLPLTRVVEERDALIEVYGWFEDVDFTTVAPLATLMPGWVPHALVPHEMKIWRSHNRALDF